MQVRHNRQFTEAPLSSIEPTGWLRQWLNTQYEGLTGHIEAAGAPFDSVFWGAPVEPESLGKHLWFPYEQTAYWIDGAIRCGHLLDNESLIEKASRQIGYAFRHADPDGYIGHPDFKSGSRWSHTVFFRACIAHHGATGDSLIPEQIRRHYLAVEHPHSKSRDVTNIEIMLWAFEKTGDSKLLEMARRAFEENSTAEPDHDCSVEGLLSDRSSSEHGVTFCEQAKLGAILYSYTGEKRHLEASLNGFRKLERDQMLMSGVPSASEHLRGKDPLDSHEVCDIADYTWSAGHLLRITGDAAWADRIERACFNAAPGAVTPDFRALQYFSCPNQLLATKRSNHNLFFRGEPWMAYRPNPGTACCPGNVNRIMPNFASMLWMQDHTGGLVAALYAPSVYRGVFGNVTGAVTVDTVYPFEETVRFRFDLPKAAHFPFTVRIPGWCDKAELRLNGTTLREPCSPGTFVTLRRMFAPGDVLELQLPMKPALQFWPRNGVSVDFGPLAFVLGVQEKWFVDEDIATGKSDARFELRLPSSQIPAGFPKWEILPDSPWNYALAVDPMRVAEQIRVERRPVSDAPWTAGTAPIRLHVPARIVQNWNLDRRSEVEMECPVEVTKDVWEARRIVKKDDYVFTPQLPSMEELRAGLEPVPVTIALVPYGCTRLRLGVFPNAAGPHFDAESNSTLFK